jgi:hypothetical protein
MMIVAAAGSLWLTDVTGRLRLSRTAVNAGILLAAAVCAARIAQSKGAWDLLLVADTLVCVQVILLFEKKSLRTWWDVAMLSLFQVLVAALLRQGPLFGVVLIAYLFFGLSTLALLLLHQEQVCFDRADADSSTDRSHRANRRSARRGRVNWRRLVKLALATLFVGPLSLFLRFREPGQSVQEPGDAGTPGARSRPRPAPGRKPVVARTSEPATNGPAIGREFWARVTGMASLSVLMSVALFCVVPRFGRIDLMFPRLGYISWNQRSVSRRRAVGFSDRVTLGELGMIIENPEEVLQMRLVDYQTGQPYPVQGDVYLRGAVLTGYQAGEWGHRRARVAQRFGRLKPDEQLPHGQIVLQKIRIQPMDREELFCVWPFVVLAEDERLQYDAQSERLRRPRNRAARQFAFELGTTAFADGRQSALVPCRKAVNRELLLEWPGDSLPGLAGQAEQWIAESEIPAGDPLDRARYLEGQLRDSNRFEYTLEGQMRDVALDPIEDFVLNNPRGHCEYFATALTLMLRSQGIPARLVVGYKCDEYSYFSQAFRVRQSHAHTWVEAYAAPSELASELPEEGSLADWPHGGWLRLDPTPVSSGGVAVVGFVAREVESWFQWLHSLWTRDVLGMNQIRQQELIYRPLLERLKQTFSNAIDRNWWRGVFRSLGRTLSLPSSNLASGWGVALLAGIALGALVAVSYCLRLLFPRFRWGPLGRVHVRRDADRPRVEFYRRLETMLARCGLTRLASQTQREFAREAGIRIAESTGRPELVPLPLQVAEAFYQVRFGRLALDGHQAAAVGDALTRLEQATNGRREKTLTAKHAPDG